MKADRIADLRSQMAAAGLDCVVMYPSANWRYVCSFAPVANERLCLLLVTAEAVAVVLPNFDVEEMTASAPDALVFGWSDLEGPERTLALAWQQVGGPGLGSLAVDDGMPYLFTRLLFGVAGAAVTAAAYHQPAPVPPGQGAGGDRGDQDHGRDHRAGDRGGRGRAQPRPDRAGPGTPHQDRAARAREPRRSTTRWCSSRPTPRSRITWPASGP